MRKLRQCGPALLALTAELLPRWHLPPPPPPLSSWPPGSSHGLHGPFPSAMLAPRPRPSRVPRPSLRLLVLPATKGPHSAGTLLSSPPPAGAAWPVSPQLLSLLLTPGPLLAGPSPNAAQVFPEHRSSPLKSHTVAFDLGDGGQMPLSVCAPHPMSGAPHTHTEALQPPVPWASAWLWVSHCHPQVCPRDAGS